MTAVGATSPSTVLPAKDRKPPRADLYYASNEGPVMGWTGCFPRLN